jgi:hypothetical protein
MQPEPAPHLARAARARHENTRAKAIRALRELDHHGDPITFQAVAETAGISRSWLYTQPDLRNEIERLRQITGRAPDTPIPAPQRATGASLLARLTHAQQRIKQLTDENQQLRRQLAHALGDRRAEQALTRTPRPGTAAN